MTTTAETTATQANRPLIARSRAELERAVIAAARGLARDQDRDDVTDAWDRLDAAVAALDEWEQLRAEGVTA
ncbi:MAG TPA: hypothetical protein VNM48_02590 [Chloroflexota bacterium]|nr:hypothetical protein [Chloroflexota bacterium]